MAKKFLTKLLIMGTLVVMCFSLVGLTGCSAKRYSESEVVEYLKNLYGHEFVIIELIQDEGRWNHNHGIPHHQHTMRYLVAPKYDLGLEFVITVSTRNSLMIKYSSFHDTYRKEIVARDIAYFEEKFSTQFELLVSQFTVSLMLSQIILVDYRKFNEDAAREFFQIKEYFIENKEMYVNRYLLTVDVLERQPFARLSIASSVSGLNNFNDGFGIGIINSNFNEEIKNIRIEEDFVEALRMYYQSLW